MFLHLFFPIAGMLDDGFGDSIMNPLMLWRMVFDHLMGRYGFFLLPAILAERQHVFRPLVQAFQAMRTRVQPADVVQDKMNGQKDLRRALAQQAMGRPYMNVIRMHLLLFFFAFCHILKIESFLVFAVVYAVYFFPWSELKKRNKSGKPVEAMT